MATTEPLPVTTAGWTMTELDGQLVALPTVELDVEERPDVADLARVHAVEGVGDIRTFAQSDDDGVRFDILVTSPVRCVLAFVVPRRHINVLESAAAQGSLVLAAGDASAVGATWLSVDIDTTSLRELLDNASD